MSEREAGLGSFVMGIALGITLGLLFAREDGTSGVLQTRVRIDTPE